MAYEDSRIPKKIILMGEFRVHRDSNGCEMNKVILVILDLVIKMVILMLVGDMVWGVILVECVTGVCGGATWNSR